MSSEIQSVVGIAEACSLVGINVSFSVQLSAALALARFIKTRAPHVMALEGSQITFLSHPDLMRLAASEHIDAVARYEGEIALECLHHAAEGRVPLKDVPNVVFRDSDGTIRANEPPCSVPLDDLPTPDLTRKR